MLISIFLIFRPYQTLPEYLCMIQFKGYTGATSK